MSPEAPLGFEEILTAMLHMARQDWKAELCVFLQLDDQSQLTVRAVDGAQRKKWEGRHFTVNGNMAGMCLKKNRIMRLQKDEANDPLIHLVLGGRAAKAKGMYMVVPVSGQSRVLGLLIAGPFTALAKTPSEHQLRNTGALCAVLTAHWRLYDWLSNFTSSVNHELRTPLTAVQGSLGMVLGGVCGEVGGEVRTMLEMAQKGCERTVRAIEDYILKQQTPSKPA